MTKKYSKTSDRDDSTRLVGVRRPHYAVFSDELNRHRIPNGVLGPVLYSYWIADNFRPGLDIERLKDDLRTGYILKRRGFGKANVATLAAALGIPNVPAQRPPATDV